MIACWINGVPTTSISALDRGFAYGDGHFTTALIVQGKIQHLEQHIERLAQACQRLKINLTEFEQLAAQLEQIAHVYELHVLKIVITAGKGGRGYSRAGVQEPTVVVSVFPYPLHYKAWQNSGIKLGKATMQLGLQPMLAGIKHLNRLEQVLIRKELDSMDVDDILVCDINNHVVETSCANIFWSKQGAIYTPTLGNAGVTGIIREKLLQLLPEVHQLSVKPDVLDDADEIWLSNSVMGVVPVNNYNGRPLAIEQGKILQELISR